jgi:hypothetical protein
MSVIVLVQGACESTRPDPAPGLRFRFEGDAFSGEYDAVGTPTLNGPDVLNEADYASALTEDATFKVIANDERGANYGDLLLLRGLPARRGTFPLSNSSGGVLHRGLTWTPFEFHSVTMFALESGTITIIEYGPSRVQGVFTGVARIPGAPPGFPGSTISIINGSFNLALDDPAAASFRCRLFLC